MAENPPTDPPAEPVVPQARSAADAGDQPRSPDPRTSSNSTSPKRATKSTKRTPRAKAAKVTGPESVGDGEAPVAKPPPRKRAPRKAAKSAPAPAAATPSPSSQPAAVEPPHSTAEEVALLERADVDAPPQPDAAHRVGAAPGAWAAAVWDAVGHLGQPPVRLAALAVNDLGPRAGAWVGWLRKTYPDASATGIARLATRQAARHGWALTSLELGGPLTAPVYLTALGWVRATLALRIAAAYGHDPADPRRADELLELLQLGPEPEEEQAGGLDLAGESGPHAAAADLDRVLRTVSRRLGVALYLIGRLRPRRGSPVSKAVGAFWSASEQQDGLDQLAHRAMLRYRPGRSS